ncbi:DUF6567 family protein [Joostella sp. CR20]|uniref:DUF6567 family protein n=1 Tax=Joostella sp. CR20 TaxID=2804312 RepID=UPI00313ACBE4
MKKIGVTALICSLFLTSCSVHNGLTTNVNNTDTSVILSKSNYKVLGTVTGDAEAMYVLGIGGISKKGMVNEAKAEMFRKAKLEGASKAIINQTVEIKHSAFPFIRMYHVYASGQVIEFTEN